MKKGMLIFLVLIAFTQVKAQEFQAKKKTLQKVFNDLVNAYGSPKTPPALELLPDSRPDKIIAQYYSNPSPLIRIDEKLFDLCMKMGADSINALSIILGHELAHYYNDHNWCSDFAFAVRNTPLGRKIKTQSKDDKINHEREADNFGLYHSCIAGYHPFNISEKLLDTIYAAYKLPDSIPDYPTKDDRKEIGKQAQERITKLYPEFTTGTAAIKNGDYDTAIKCFKDLNIYFASRENYNNSGIAKTLYALMLKPLSHIENIDTIDFIYPLEIDHQSRLHANKERSEPNYSVLQKMNDLLNSAERDFVKAISLDSSYDKAFINLSCVYDLQGNYEAAIGEIKKLPTYKRNQEKAYRILGIAYYHNDEKKMSKEMFEKAALITNK